MKRSLFAILLLSTMLFFSACGGGNDADTEATDDGTETIVVGTMTGYQPYTYVDTDDTVKGFEVAVVDEAVSRMDNMKVEYVALPWESLLPSLQSGKCQLVSCQLWRNEERVAKYNMATVPYFECGSRLMVGKDTNDVETLEDLKGRPIGTTVGDSFTLFLEEYNEENNDVLDIKYYSEDISTILQDIAAGRLTATVNEPNMMMSRAEAMKIEGEIKLVGDLIGSGFTYLAFPKTDEGNALREKFDAVYLEMMEDGTLSKLSKEYFNGEDYSVNLKDGIIAGE